MDGQHHQRGNAPNTVNPLEVPPPHMVPYLVLARPRK